MSWTKKQQNLARAVEHGFKPTGQAKGFTKSLADLILTERSMGTRKKGNAKA